MRIAFSKTDADAYVAASLVFASATCASIFAGASVPNLGKNEIPRLARHRGKASSV